MAGFRSFADTGADGEVAPLVFAGVTLPLSMDFAVGHQAIHSVVAYAQRLDADAEASAAMLAEHFRSRRHRAVGRAAPLPPG
jgi:hypothetical protein